MLKYFIIFTAIGLLIGRLERMDARIFYIALISLGWASYTEFIWGLAAMGELYLGTVISRAIWPPSDAKRQTAGIQYRPEIPSNALPSLILFRAKTLKILAGEMSYTFDITGPMQETFNKATRGALENGLNEYDAAIIFMLTLLKRMDRPVSKHNLESYLEKLCECMKLAPRSIHSIEFLNIYIKDHRSDFSPDLLERPELSFVSKILNEDDRSSIGVPLRQPDGMPPQSGTAASRTPDHHSKSGELPSLWRSDAPSASMPTPGVASPLVRTASASPDCSSPGTQCSCGTELMPTMRFCPSCGSRILATAPIESDSRASPASARPDGTGTPASTVYLTFSAALDAAERGDVEAQVIVGKRYAQGDGVQKDDLNAALWIRKAAEEHGHAEAQLLYGAMYATGWRGVPQSHALAAAWYLKAAQQGCVDAQASLGVMYAQGEGIQRDDRLAVYWWSKAAEQGDVKAQAGLGCMYHLGHGVSQDYGKAEFWSRKAAEQGNAIAQAILGSMYAAGQGVPEDKKQAYFWYSLAAEHGHGPAIALLPHIKELLTPVQRAEVQSDIMDLQRR